MVDEHLSFQMVELMLHAACFETVHPFIVFLQVCIQVFHTYFGRSLHRFVDARQAEATFLHGIRFVIG